MRVLYFGPIAVKGRPAGGGYESANRKNIDVLRNNGVNVVEFRNPTVRHFLGIITKFVYIKLFFTPLALLKYWNKKDTVIHITPLFAHLLWPSFLVVLLANYLRIPLLLDIRAGALIALSKSKSRFWFAGVKYMLIHATKITVEGKSYINEIPKTFGINKQIYYFPNITYCKNLIYVQRESNPINLIYFGRITQAKGVDVILKMMPLLGDNYRLYLAGQLGADIYPERLNINNVVFLGPLSPIQLEDILNKAHIFVFPTQWYGEGQSNSLIEAMQHGIIPITSDQGFCKDVVDDCGIVLPIGSNENDYKNAVLTVSKSNMEDMGKKAINHIYQSHNIDKWVPWLIKLYSDML